MRGRGHEAPEPELAEHILQPLKSQGVYAMGDFAIAIRVKIMTKPGEQFTIRRAIWALILGTIGTFLVFAQISVMTQGGPLRTTLAPLYLIYQKTLGTGTRAEAGFAAAMAFILAAIIITINIIQRRYIERSTEQI